MTTATLDNGDGKMVQVELLKGARVGKPMLQEHTYIYHPNGGYGMTIETAVSLGYARILEAE